MAKSKKNRALKPPSDTFRPQALKGSVGFADEHLDLATWTAVVESSGPWMHSANRLLRSANALHGLIVKPRRAPPKHLPPNILRESVDTTAFMLAAMAIECALKGYIVAHKRVAFEKPDMLPAVLRSHDLVELLQRANEAGGNPPLVAANANEEQLILCGQQLIEYAGRYPTTIRANEHPRSMSWSPYDVVPACNAFIERVMDRIAVTEYASSPQIRAHGSEREYRRWIRAVQRFAVGPLPHDGRTRPPRR